MRARRHAEGFLVAPLDAQQHRLGQPADVRPRSDEQRGLGDDGGAVLGVGGRPRTEQQARLFGYLAELWSGSRSGRLHRSRTGTGPAISPMQQSISA
jgi:hypothetical protein